LPKIFLTNSKSPKNITFTIWESETASFEVKSKMAAPEIPQHLRTFLDKYPNAPGAIVFNDSLRDSVSYENRIVEFLPWFNAEKIPFLSS
jgi:hypothetical protein